MALAQNATCSRFYTVNLGDTCDAISADQDVSTYQLAFVNQGRVDAACDNLAEGEPLCLGIVGQDCGSVHVVYSGDSCANIVSTTGVSLSTLLANNPNPAMKILTLNFLTCAVKACKSSSASFPLHPKDCSLVSDTIAPNPKLLLNILPRVDWDALIVTASELGFPSLPPAPPTAADLESDAKMQAELHALLLETQISEGSLVCGNCGHEYRIKEGIANFLLPSHLV